MPAITEPKGDGEPITLALDPYVGRLVTVTIGVGDGSYRFLFDTGGGWTTVTPKVAGDAGCVPFGRLVGFRMSGEKVPTRKCGRHALVLADTALRDVAVLDDVGVFDIMALLPEGVPELGGVFALSTLKDRPFTLDLESRQLILETPRSLARRTEGRPPSRIRIGREAAGYGAAIFVEVAANPEPLWCLLDSANLDAVIVAPHTLEQLGMKLDDPRALTGENTFPIDIVVAGRPVRGAEARVRDIIHDGAISEAVMRRFVITADLAGERIWFAPRAAEAFAGAKSVH